jgi:hypothetical protein
MQQPIQVAVAVEAVMILVQQQQAQMGVQA